MAAAGSRILQLRLAIAVGFAAFALYLLSFGGVFHNAADEWLMFATTESLAKGARADVDQLFWVGEHMGWARFGIDGHLYVKYTTFSAGQSLAGIPAYSFARLIPGAGLAQGTLLTNAVVVAALLALLVLTLGELGFSPGVSLATAALFGVGSALWPYSQTYFGEPLLGLAYLACFYCLARKRGSTSHPTPSPLAERGRRPSPPSPVGKGAGGLGLPSALPLGLAWALAVVAKPTGLLVGPFLAGYLLVSSRGEPWPRRLRAVATFVLPSAAVGAAIIVLSAARFGLGQGFLHANSFSTPLPVGLWGLLLSPGRSFFLYSPVAVLALPGCYFLWRRDRLLTGTLVSFLALYLVFLALWSDWYGGRTNWGPRHLVPTLPLFALGAAGLLAAETRQRLVRALAGLAGLAGVAVQLSAVANDYLPTMLGLIERYPAPIPEEAPAAALAFASFRQAPILQQWRLLPFARSDLSWLHGRGGFDAVALGLSLGLLALAGAYLLAVYRGRPLGLSRWAPPALAAAALLAVALLLPHYADHPRYGPPEYRQALERFDREAPAGAALVTLDTESHRAFNYQRRASRRYGLPGGKFESLPPPVARLLDRIVRGHDEVWLLATGDEVGTVEREVRDRLPLTEEWRWGEFRLIRARRAGQAASSE